MTGPEHYRRAEELLSKAEELFGSDEPSAGAWSVGQAQVHATLALSAPAGKGPPRPGRDEAADTQSTGAAHPDMPEGGGPRPARPAGQPESLSSGNLSL